MLQVENELKRRIDLLDNRFYTSFNNDGFEVNRYRIDLTSDDELNNFYNKIKDLSDTHIAKITGRKYKKIVFKRG